MTYPDFHIGATLGTPSPADERARDLIWTVLIQFGYVDWRNVNQVADACMAAIAKDGIVLSEREDV